MVVLPCSMALKHMVHRTAAVAKVDGDSCVPSSSKLARMTEVMTDECSCGSSLSTLYTWHQIYIFCLTYICSANSGISFMQTNLRRLHVGFSRSSAICSSITGCFVIVWLWPHVFHSELLKPGGTLLF